MDIKKQIKKYVQVVQTKSDLHYAPTGLDCPKIHALMGRKYAKLVIRGLSGDCVHTFVNMGNGDILKSASWNAPAKHARGNIFSEDIGASAVDHFGAHYLR